jgi:acyl-CoA thioesterase FadM
MPTRADYRHFQPILTRWHDNDVYGHVNNVTYYSYFDTAVNTYLIERGGMDIHDGGVVGFVVSSSCDYFTSVACSMSLRCFGRGRMRRVRRGRSFTYSWSGRPISRRA